MYTPGNDLAPVQGGDKTDTKHLLVLLERDLSADSFQRLASEYGQVINYLPSIATAFLRLHSPDSDGRQIQEVRAIPGVIWADYNTRTLQPKTAYALPATARMDNSAIYNELDLYTAWNITRGDPRIKIGVVDTGCSLRHPDINAQSGGVFMEGVHASDAGFPIKLDLNWLFRLPWNDNYIESPYVAMFAYDPARRDQTQRFYGRAVMAYSDSTCKTMVSDTGGTLYPYQHSEVWVNEPVDVVLVGMPNEIDTVNLWQFAVGRREMCDGYGHGTPCTGIVAGKHAANSIAGIAPDCTTLHYRISNDDGDFADDLNIIPALDKAVTDGCHIISMSLGAFDYPTAAFIACINRILSAGVVFLCAVGNEGRYPGVDSNADLYEYPAAYPGVLGIGASGYKSPPAQLTGFVDDEGDFIDYSRMAPFTQKHNKVFAVAPGYGYIVHIPTNSSKIWKTIGGTGPKYYAYQRSGGTSWATPCTAGVCGLMLSKAIQPYSTTDPMEVRNILNSVCNSTRVKTLLASTANPTVRLSIGGVAGLGFGAGRINAGAAVVAV